MDIFYAKYSLPFRQLIIFFKFIKQLSSICNWAESPVVQLQYAVLAHLSPGI